MDTDIIEKAIAIKRPFRMSLFQAKCFVEECKNLQLSKGHRKGVRYFGKVCNYHHQTLYGIDTRKKLRLMVEKKKTAKQNIINKKCQVCGWRKSCCDRHRLFPEKGYVTGNVIILCPNCHRLATFHRYTRKFLMSLL